jgi:hypothetical protein
MTEASKNKEPGSSKDHKLFISASVLMAVIFLALVGLIIWGRLAPVANISPAEAPPREIYPNENSLLIVLAISGFFYLVFLLILKSLQGYKQPLKSNPESKDEFNSWFVFGTLISGMLVIGALILLATGRVGLSNAPEVQTGIVIVLAVSVLTLLLFILTLGFRSLGLADEAQPLALPSGSVRAFIALTLIMIFVILSVYAVRFVGEGVYTDSGIYTLPDYLELAKTAESDKDHLVKRQVQCPPGINSENGGNLICYRVWRVTTPSDDGIRLAQQLTTTVATLVVAVASFYFGAQSVEQAKKTVSSTTNGTVINIPSITSIKPNKGETATFVSVTLQGRNLLGTQSVRLVKDKDKIEAENVLVGEMAIQCSFQLNKPAGTGWNLVVENIQGQRGELENAFTITESQEKPPDTPSIQPPPQSEPPTPDPNQPISPVRRQELPPSYSTALLLGGLVAGIIGIVAGIRRR